MKPSPYSLADVSPDVASRHSFRVILNQVDARAPALGNDAAGLLNIIDIAMSEARRLGFAEAAELLKIPALSVVEAALGQEMPAA